MITESILQAIQVNKNIDQNEAKQLMHAIIEKQISDVELAGVLMLLEQRGVKYDELMGFSEALLEVCVPTPLPQDAIDLCGTGGDMKDTFNISTLSSLLLASMHYPIIKHGNYSATSTTGSSQILELMGYTFSNNIKQLTSQFEKFGFCYLHAPLFHPAVKNIATVRKALKIKTVFNILGPLCHPSNPKFRFHGVNSLSLLNLYSRVLSKRGNHFAVYHTITGYDEISLTAPFIYHTNKGANWHNPQQEGIDLISPDDIKSGKTQADNVAIFKNILNGKGTSAQNQVLAYNAARVILLYYNHDNSKLQSTYEKCLNHLLSGKTKQTLEQIINFQNP